MTPLQILMLVIAAIGVFFMFVSAIGIVRLPDVYARMHAAGKASTLGVTCLLVVAGIQFGQDEMFRMIVLIVLFFITAPVATTTMARAAYRTDARRHLVLHYDDIAAPEPRDTESQNRASER
jgi:multicomponent Na+:H+ antiporter subunit G